MSKSKISKRTITLGCILVALALCVIFITVFIKLGGSRLFNNNSITIDEVKNNITSAMNKYIYSRYDLVIQDTVKDGDVTIYEYKLSAEKQSKKRTYAYKDSTGASLYQYWDYDIDNKNYLIYVYDYKHEVWVKTSYDSEPVTTTPWDIFDNLSDYTMLQDTDTWYTSDDECYVLETIGSTEEYSTVYSMIYIRCSDWLPMGMVTYGVSDDSQDKIKHNIPIDISGNDNVDVDSETYSYNEKIVIYDVTFSNDDLSILGIPTEYIEEDEYMFYYLD